MNKTSLLGATALRTFAAAGLAFGFAGSAYAQETQAEEQPTPTTVNPDGSVTCSDGSTVPAATGCGGLAAATSEQEAESGTTANSDSEIVVTGSRIRRPNLDSPLPVTSVGGDEFFETGQTSVGDVLNELPALRSTFSQANSTRFLGTAGLNLLDLRGLGTVRTLVLQNGRRHVGGDVLSSGVTPDVNTIPTDLIERVDIVTGGNSAVYGSDAIAGVVNFILKDDYDGIQLRGQSGVSTYGDAGAYFVSGLAGRNFADGRGNVALNVEYARQNQYFGSGRPHLARQDAFLVVDADPAGSDGIPDRIFFRDVRTSSLNNTGIVRFGGTNAGNSCGVDPTGGFYPCAYTFQPDGQLIPLTGVRTGLAPGSFIGGNSENFRGGNQLQLSPQLDRYNLNLIARFEIAPALVPFVEAKYSRTDTSGTGSSGPAFTQGVTLGDPAGFDPDGPDGPLVPYRNREQIRLDNPFLNPQARAVICEQRALSALPCTDATQISVRENLLGLGARTEDARRNTFRIVGGLRGEFNDDWSYEASVNYGRLKESTKLLGTLDIQRYLLAIDAVRDPATGNIVCASQINPAAAIGADPSPGPFGLGTDPNGAARLAADIAACVPINILGGQFTQDQRDYVLRDTVARGKTSQFNALAYVSGDSSQLFNLPGGPIGFVLGAEYRADDLFYNQDQDIQLGYTFYNAIPTFNAPKSKVKEAFGELRLPLLKDQPFFQELEVSLAARVSDYSIGNTGTVWAYNGSAVWAPVNGLRFRGNYGRSVRAPNQVELFSPFSQNFAPAFADPCSSVNIGAGSENRAANCAAAGRPGGTNTTLNPSNPVTPPPNPTGPYDFRYQESLEVRSGGNPLLEAEKSDSWTVGFVATPRFLPGFSFSADYYNIEVENVITSVAAQTIVDQCYDLPAGNPFCDLFERAGPGGGPGGEQEFRIIEGTLIQGPVNFAKLVAKGIDLEVGYRSTLGDLGRLDTRLTYTRVLDRSDFLDPANPDFKDVIVGKKGGELGDPRDSFNWNSSLKRGPVTFGYQMRYIGKMVLNEYENLFSVQDRDPENEDYADRRFYPHRFYHDVRFGIDATDKFNFYLGVDNVTNSKPPLDLTGLNAGQGTSSGASGIYDNRGRFFYAGAVAKF